MVTKSVSAARKGAARRSELTNSTWEQAEFIQRELTEGEQRACKDWPYTEVDAFSELIALSVDGFKVTFRFDDWANCHSCWFLPPKDHPENKGLILTGRGSTPFKAFKQALYKHLVLFQGQWPRGGDRRGEVEIDD